MAWATPPGPPDGAFSRDRFEDADHNPEAPIEDVPVMLVDRMRAEHELSAAQAGAGARAQRRSALTRRRSGQAAGVDTVRFMTDSPCLA
jgi:hypothetical protein